ncbi:MAG: nitroreductase [Eubacterium sp.]|jgi:hypothetical protein|nr:nitroreductase [Eubacterium sp.]
MKINDALNLRHSRRTYLDCPMSNEDAKKLCDAIQKCNALSGLHMQLITEEKMAFKGSMFKNVRNYIAMVGRGDDITREKCGYFGEKIVLFATGLGLGTCWSGTFNRAACRFDAFKDEILHLVIAIGPVRNKMTQRESVISGISHINSRGRKKISRIFGDAPPWFWSGIDAVLKAPSAMNRRPVTLSCNDGEITASISGKKDYEYIDLGIAKLHFEIGALGGDWEWGNGGTFIVN